MNTNTEYEKFTRDVCERLALYKGVQSSSVQHDVKLKGKSGFEHQVDVYWEYQKDGEVLVDEEWAAKHKIDLATYRERLDFIQTKRDNKWSKSTHLPLDICDIS